MLEASDQLGSRVVESFVRRFRDESKIHYRLSRVRFHNRPHDRGRNDDWR